MNQRLIDLPYIMVEHIVYAREYKKDLPYGLIFTNIFKYHWILMDMREVDASPQSDAFNFQTLGKTGYKKNSRGEWVSTADSSNDSGGKEGGVMRVWKFLLNHQLLMSNLLHPTWLGKNLYTFALNL